MEDLKLHKCINWVVHRCSEFDKADKMVDEIRLDFEYSLQKDSKKVKYVKLLLNDEVSRSSIRKHISLFSFDSQQNFPNHYFPTSQQNYCFMSPNSINSLDGLGIVYDAKIKVKLKYLKDGGQAPDEQIFPCIVHYSLVCTEDIEENLFKQKVSQFFGKFTKCTLSAGAESIELSFIHDDDVKTDFENHAVFCLFDNLRRWGNQSQSPMEKFDCFFLHHWIHENNPSMKQILDIPFFKSFIGIMMKNMKEDDLAGNWRIEYIKDEITDSGFVFSLENEIV